LGADDLLRNAEPTITGVVVAVAENQDRTVLWDGVAMAPQMALKFKSDAGAGYDKSRRRGGASEYLIPGGVIGDEV